MEGSAVNATVKINQVVLQVLFIFLPTDLVDPHGSFPFEAVKAVPEQIDVDVM